MTLHKYPNWNRLIGATIEIRQHGQTIRTGTVDDAMADSTALWLASDGVQPRTIYEAALNYEAWLEPRQLTGTSSYRMTSALLHPDDQENDHPGSPAPPAADSPTAPEYSAALDYRHGKDIGTSLL